MRCRQYVIVVLVAHVMVVVEAKFEAGAGVYFYFYTVTASPFLSERSEHSIHRFRGVCFHKCVVGLDYQWWADVNTTMNLRIP